MTFADRCGVADASRPTACAQALVFIREHGLDLARIAWCDLHGALRCKTLVAGAVADALAEGMGMVSTLLLKDSSDRTAFQVFEPGGTAALPGFGQADNLLLLPDPASLRVLPWAPGTGWMQAMSWFADGTPVAIDPRRVLQAALARLAAAGFGLKCGLEVEFHIYRIVDDHLDPAWAAWPGEPPSVAMVHPGFHLLSEGWADLADEPLRIVQRTAQALGLPLRSLEIELGPSQFEAVFDATDALTAADHLLLFRSGVRQALRRAGYHASFVCRPPFPNVMSSGWHLHQSLVDLASGANAFQREQPAAGSRENDAAYTLSATGEHWLAGLLAHAVGMAVFCTPTVNGYGRFRPNVMAPMAACWGRDNRGAMLRVLGGAGDAATRIENRLGEPLSNPYLCIAAQVFAGLDGIERGLAAGPATEAPYATVTATTVAAAGQGAALPASLGQALDALAADDVLAAAFGPELVSCLTQVKRAELARHDAAKDGDEWQRREYFSRS